MLGGPYGANQTWPAGVFRRSGMSVASGLARISVGMSLFDHSSEAWVAERGLSVAERHHWMPMDCEILDHDCHTCYRGCRWGDRPLQGNNGCLLRWLSMKPLFSRVRDQIVSSGRWQYREMDRDRRLFFSHRDGGAILLSHRDGGAINLSATNLPNLY